MRRIAMTFVVAAALAGAACGPSPADFEAAMDEHYYGRIAAVDSDIVGVNAAAAKVEEFQFLTIAPGVWRSTVNVSGDGARDVRQRCHRYPRRLDQALDLTPVWTMTKDCKISTKWTSGSYTIEYACDDGRQRMNASARVTGDFTKRYMIEAKYAYSPARRGARSITTTTTAERVGDC